MTPAGKTRHVHVLIEEERYQALRARAYREAVSLGELVRRVVQRYLDAPAPPDTDTEHQPQ